MAATVKLLEIFLETIFWKPFYLGAVSSITSPFCVDFSPENKNQKE